MPENSDQAGGPRRNDQPNQPNRHNPRAGQQPYRPGPRPNGVEVTTVGAATITLTEAKVGNVFERKAQQVAADFHPSLLGRRTGIRPTDGGTSRDNFANLFRQLVEDHQMDVPLLAAQHRRTDTMIAKLRADGWLVLELEAQAISRVRTGVGGDTPLQAELERDHVCGWPKLPASGLRGSMVDDFESGEVPPSTGHDPSELEREDTAVETSSVWKLFDALPIDPCQVIADVFTPHTSDWHMNDGLPNRWESPIPVPVMSIERGARFRIVMAARPEHKSELDAASLALIKALLVEGFGSRTTRGMGYFKTISNAKRAQPKELQNK
jgi:CRISPR/Cas system CMR subunit Cmr6 (Cas7 group RAMP superfamily)